MKRVRKRICSLLLAIVMAVSLLPTSAWAAEQRTDEAWKSSTYGQELITAGYEFAGSYMLDNTDIIYASFMIYDREQQRTSFAYIFADGGGGAGKNITFTGSAPWSEMNLDRVYIEDGITGIGDNAFANQVTMTDAVLPQSLTSIGNNAFTNNRQMQVTVTDSEGNVVDFSNVTTIGNSAFLNCTSLGAGGDVTLKLGENLTIIGENAFNSTNIRNVEFEELTEGTALTIGDSAFAWCGIESIVLPDGLTTIGDHAFAYNRLEGSLVIPDSVTRIEDEAFFVSSDSKNTTLTELTLGKNLAYVGESAFRNYTGLATVNIRTTNTDLTLGDLAFGHDQDDAYWTDRNIDGQNYFVGADFKIVDATMSPETQEGVLDAFENGVNCYMGAISPLRLTGTVDPTCLTDGRNEYEYTLTVGTGNTQTKELYEEIPHLEHIYVAATPKTIDPSCEQPGRNLYVCMNAQGLIDSENPQDVTVTDVSTGAQVTVLASGGHYRAEPIEGQTEKGHNYQPSTAVDAEINGDTGSGTTTLTYACTTEGHINAGDADFNSYGNVIAADTRPKTVNFTVNWRPIQVTTVTTLDEIEEQLAGMVSNSAGTLSIVHENGQDGDTTLTAGEHDLELLFTPSSAFTSNYTGMTASSEFGTDTLTLHVTVKKYALNFTNVFFMDAGATVSQTSTAPATTIHPTTPAPEEAGKPVFSYRPATDADGWRAEVPDITEAAPWYVRAVFDIDEDKYTVDDLTHVGSASGYSLAYNEETGEVTITANYNVLPLNMDAIEVHVTEGTYGDGAESSRVNLLNVPGNSTVSYTITREGTEAVSGSISTTGNNPEESENMFIGTFTYAGTYQVSITVTNHSSMYDPSIRTLTAQVVVNKRPIDVPDDISLTYDPTNTRQQGVVGGDSSPYTLEDDCYADNAGDYEGTVILKDPNNTKWSNTDEASTTVSYTIEPVRVVAPNLTSGFAASYPYDGTTRTAVPTPTSADFTYHYVDGELIGYYKDSPVFTVTDAQRTDAGAYSTVASLHNPDGVTNYVWFDTGNASDRTLVASWAITRANYELPDITIGTNNSVEYTGQALDENTIRFGTQTKDDYSLSLIGDDTLTVGSYTWLENGQAINGAPTDVGSYQLRVTFNLSNGAKLSNYTFTGDENANDDVVTRTVTVEITKATLTLAAGEAITATFTGSLIAMPQVTITDGLLAGQTTAALQYTYTPVDEDPNDGSSPQPVTKNEPFTFNDVGTYVVSVQPAAASNYTGTAVNVTLTITSADQQVRLEADNGTTLNGDGTDTPYTVTKELADGSFYVTGKGYVNNTEPTEDYETNADVSYSSGTQTVATVNDYGAVTIQGAGETLITVTAAADDSGHGNYREGTATYTLTVNKATPTIDISEYEDGRFVTGYTGNPITGYDKATLSGVTGIDPTGDLVYTFYTDQECATEVTNGGGTDGNIPIAVDTYYLKVSYAGDDNYNLAESAAIPVEVTKANVGDVDIANYSDTYDGQAHSLNQQEVTVADFEENDYTVQYAASATQPDADDNVWENDVTVKDVADSTGATKYWYKVTINGGNYAPAIGEINVTIDPAPLTVDMPASFEKEYDGDRDVDVVAGNITVTTGVTGETITVSSAAGTYDDENAGEGKEVTLNLTLDGDNITWGNYSYDGEALTEGSLTLTETTGEITKKSITVTGGIGATNKVYDGNGTITLTGTPETEGFVTDDNVDFSEITDKTGTVENPNVGGDKEVTVTAETLNDLLTGDDAGNYEVTANYTGARVNITKRPVYLLFPNQTDTPWKDEVAYTPAGLTSQPAVYQVSAKDADDVSGFVSPDSLETGDIAYTFADSEGVPVTNPQNLGTYTVTAALTTEATQKFSNYSIASISGTIEIIPNNEELTVDIELNTGLTYTGLGQDPISNITVTGGTETLNEGEGGYTIAYTLDGDGNYDLDHGELTAAIEDAGDYTVYWQVTTTNYGTQNGSFTVAIAKAQMTLSRDVTITRPYDGTTDAAEQVAHVELHGQVNSEDIEVAVTSAVYNDATVDDAQHITITYALTAAEGVSLDNYTVSINNAAAQNADETMTENVTAQIKPAEVTVTINDQTAVYDGSQPEVANVQGTDWKVTSGTVYNSDNLNIELSLSTGAENVGGHSITGTWDNTNYNMTFQDEDGAEEHGTFTVTARPVAVTIGDKSGIYGDEPDVHHAEDNVTLTNTSTAEGEGIVTGESIYSVLTGLNLTTNATAESDVGDSYTISEDNGVYGNYDVTFTNGTYTVNKRPITITIADKSSAYGCTRQDLNWDDSYTGDSSKNGIVNNDDLEIALSTDASNTADAGTYAIYVESMNETVAANYEVTVVGQTPFDSNNAQATYTINKANLTIEFPNESVNVSMGGSVNNPLEFTNTSAGTELGSQPGDVEVKYESDTPSVAAVNESTGEITIVGPGDATITATVTSGGQNFVANSSDQYIIHVAGASAGIQVQTTPNTNLVYNGSMQQLLAGYTVTPSNANVTFTVTANDSGDSCGIDDETGMPMAQDAGTYCVRWTATLAGYTEVTGWVNVTIDKADPSTGFSRNSVQTTYEENKVFDSTVGTGGTTLNKADDYTGRITYLSNDTTVARVDGNSLATIAINATGTATISASFEETENYNAQTVSFTLEVIDSETAIQYSAVDYEEEYDGRPHGADIDVTSPSDYTIIYSNDNGSSYTLTESPTITNVSESPLIIHFQIQASGYTSVNGTQTVTIEPKTITPGMVSGIANSYTYTGQQITMDNTLTVVDDGTLLDRGTDYTVTYGDNTAVGTDSGSVTITGMGNYTGRVTKTFEIAAVEASYLSASLDRYFGYYGDSTTNNATVTVMHGAHPVTEGVSVTVTGPSATVNDQTVTFNSAGVYTIQVEVTGSHTGSFTLYYTLLPQDSGGAFDISGLGDNIVTYDGQNHAFMPSVSASDGTQLTVGDYTLTYRYTPFVGTEISAGTAYDPSSTQMVEAGLYIVTVNGTGNHTGTAFVALLIAQRNLADSDVDATVPDATYDGSEQEPDVTLSYNNSEISDFTTEYFYNVNAGTALAVSSADADNNNFTGTRVDEFDIEPKSITNGFTAVANPVEYNYTGEVIIPTVNVTDTETNETLVLNTDYTVTADGILPGVHQATVTGIGNYSGEVLVNYTILADPGEPVTGLELTVTPARWTYGDGTQADISVTFDGNPITNYTLTVVRDGTALVTDGNMEAAIAALVEPGNYTITANGTGGYADTSDTATVTIVKIRPTVTITASPSTLSGGGIVTLTISGSRLPAGTDLMRLLSVDTRNGTSVNLSTLNWTTQSNGTLTADLSLANADETYTFTLNFAGDDHYEAASDTDIVVTARRTSGGGGGGTSGGGGGGGTVTPPDEDPDDDTADPDGTGVSDWLDTSNHRAYLSGYPDQTFGTDRNMTRAEVAQMFYALLLDKDVTDTRTFSDVSEDAWYATAVKTMAALGVMGGYPDGTFRPEQPITRAEFSTVALAFAYEPERASCSYRDVKNTDWFYPYVAQASTYGWIGGYPDNTFRPDNSITRAEVCVIVNNMLGRSADERFVDRNRDELASFSDLSNTHWAYYTIMEATNGHDYTKANGTENWIGLN